MMNNSTSTPRPSPVLANLAVGDLVRSRRHDTNGIVVGIEYIGVGIVVHNRHFVVTVTWFGYDTPTKEDVGTIMLLDGSSVVINHTPETRGPIYKDAHPSERGSARRAPIEFDIRLPKEPTRFPDADPAMVQAQPVSAVAPNTPAPATTAAPAARKRWSKVQIVAMIKEKEGAVDRGVLCLNKHAALLPEKSRSFVAFWAGWVGSGKTLSGKHLVNARRTCLFNAKVLVDAANGDI
jgi:hypothetical protein